MTVENSKKLYDHYVEIGNTKAAENMLTKYPDFAKEPKEEPKPEKKEKSKKSKD